MAGKIGMAVPLVEMDGDEMTRILWHMIREILIEPYVDLRTEYYDLGLKNRDETGDGVTLDAASAVRRLGVGVKCATITPNAQRMEEYGLREMWRSPNATIRAHLDGTIFRVPILAASIKPFVRTWKKPITIARHAYGDIYRGVEMRVPGKGQAHLVFTDGSGSRQRISVHDFEGPGVLMGMHNLDGSITSFARSCFRFALETKQDLWFSAKDTVSRIYDHRFKDIFARIFEEEFKERFGQTGIRYFYTLIDDAAARVLGSEGGFIWACKNYDGDVMSDLVGGGFGSIAMMNSVLVSPEEKFVYEAAHGTVTKHYYEHLKGKFTSTNPMATLFAWTGALRKRGELDGCIELARFSERLERSAEQAINNGVMTGDLAKLSDHPGKRVVTSAEFLGEVRSRLEDPRTDV
ncbi:MAG: NADP-dependent isocitrate dehydrogenase [Synergistaceae bacterium]|nr:NADP-dependent isocitrate dehydrogenase [Synergistaceae bacterium]